MLLAFNIHVIYILADCITKVSLRNNNIQTRLKLYRVSTTRINTNLILKPISFNTYFYVDCFNYIIYFDVYQCVRKHALQNVSDVLSFIFFLAWENYFIHSKRVFLKNIHNYGMRVDIISKDVKMPWFYLITFCWQVLNTPKFCGSICCLKKSLKSVCTFFVLADFFNHCLKFIIYYYFSEFLSQTMIDFNFH